MEKLKKYLRPSSVIWLAPLTVGWLGLIPAILGFSIQNLPVSGKVRIAAKVFLPLAVIQVFCGSPVALVWVGCCAADFLLTALYK